MNNKPISRKRGSRPPLHDVPAAVAIRRASRLPANSDERAIIEILYRAHADALNPMPWKTLAGKLAARGIIMTKEEFQNTILARSRSSNWYIGSRIVRPGGYCLVWTEEDLRLCMKDARHRIRQMERNLAHFNRLGARLGWAA